MMCIKLYLVLLLVSVVMVYADTDIKNPNHKKGLSKKCPVLTAPANGTIECVHESSSSFSSSGSSSSSDDGSFTNCKEAIFACDLGYMLIGNETLTCVRDTGEWSDPVPTCMIELLWQCDFESTPNGNQLCDMEQPTTDNFNWTLHSGIVPSPETGPSSAKSGTYYIYIETSRPRLNGDVALIYSPPLTLYTGPACIKFYKHMYGIEIKTLGVYILNGDVLWTQSGDQGNQWDEISITADLQVGDQIVFSGERGTSFRGDIALDNIRIAPFACPSEA